MVIMVNQAHKDRIHRELRAAGVTRYGMQKSESKYLPQVIHEDEHIGGVVYGRLDGEFSMLVATDSRIIFMQRMTLFTTTDELTYDVVSGIKSNDVGLFSSVTLHTRIADYPIRYANPKCAHKFVKYIESRRVERDASSNAGITAGQHPAVHVDGSIEGLEFVKDHDLAVLSTVDRTGIVNGAVVYYFVEQDNSIYILTRSESAKARGLLAHGQVALTIHEPGTLKTAQLQGSAEVVTDQATRNKIFDWVIKPRPYQGKMELPPVTKLKDGGYMVVRIVPTNIHYTDYSKA